MALSLSVSWWALLLRGIAAILFGLVALVWPGITLVVLVLFYGVYALVDGIFALVAGARADGGPRRWVLLAEGILDILVGFIALVWPGLTAFALLYIIAFWAILGGLLRIAGAVMLRREIDNEWSLILSGILSVVLGVILAALPGVGLISLVWVLGIFALGVGATLVVLAFRVRGHTPPPSRVV